MKSSEAAQIASEESTGVEVHHLLVILDRVKKLGAVIAVLASIPLLALVSQFVRSKVGVPTSFEFARIAFERFLARVDPQMLNQTEARLAPVIASGALVRLRAVIGHVILQRFDLIAFERAESASEFFLDHFNRRLFQLFSVFLDRFQSFLFGGGRGRGFLSISIRYNLIDVRQIQSSSLRVVYRSYGQLLLLLLLLLMMMLERGRFRAH